MSALIRAVWLLLGLVLTLGASSPALAQPAPADSDTDASGGVLGTVADLTDPLVRIKAGVIGDGIVRNGEFAALFVRLRNLGDPVTGTLVVESRSSSGETLSVSREVELPAGATKDVRLLFKPGIGGNTRIVDFVAGARSVRAEVPIRWVGNKDVAVGVIGDDAAGVNLVRETWGGRVPARAPLPESSSPGVGMGLGDQGRSVQVGLLPLATFPDRANGLDPFNELVWIDADPTRLSPEQSGALRAWVAGGGHLVLTVTERWRQVGEGPLGDVIPVRLSGVRDGYGAARLAGQGDPAPQAIARPVDDPERRIDVLVQDEGDAIWTVGTYGLGTVHVLAVDPRLEPVSTFMDRRRLWHRLLWLPEPGDTSQFFMSVGASTGGSSTLPPARSMAVSDYRLDPYLLAAMDLTPSGNGLGYAGYSITAQEDVFGQKADKDQAWFEGVLDFLQDIPGVAPIPMEWLLGFAAVYLLVIGPLDYFVLRALKRQTWTWITFPVSIAVFSTLALVGVSYVKGSQAVVTRYEVVDVLPGTNLWRGSSWYGVWSTRATTLSMTSGAGDGVAEIIESTGFKNNVRTVHGTAGSALLWDAQTWSMAFARTSWTAPGTGRITATRLGDGSVELRNDTGHDLTDLVVGSPAGGLLELDALPSGGTVQIRVPTTMETTDSLPYPDEALELVDARPWAVRQAIDFAELRRGHVEWSEWDLIVAGVTTGPIEESVLDGLTPNPRTLTVVRAPLLIRESGS